MNGYKSAYLAWQAPERKDWHVVGMLSESDNGYYFSYTNGAKASDKFIPFSGMEDMDAIYRSEDLFPLFRNRLLSERRPEYPKFIQWLGLSEKDATPVSILGRSGATRSTDKLQMFSCIELQDDGRFEHIFFVHGLGYLDDRVSERVSRLRRGDELFLCLDVQNKHDPEAVLIRAEAPAEILGYFPRYLAKDISNFLKDSPEDIKVIVEALSEEAPPNYQLQCRLTGNVGKTNANFMNGDEYKPIVSPDNSR